MKKTLKVIAGVFIVISIIGGIFYGSKENPRVYLSDRINMAYVNENISNKNFKNIIELLSKSGVSVDSGVEKGLGYVNGLYILSDSSFITSNKSFVGIIDFGYKYPIVALKIEDYFDKDQNFYILKDQYRKKYLKGEKLYLKVEKGNFIVAQREKDIQRILKNEKYFNQSLLKILDREKEKNLGMLIVNLAKSPLAGFNELVMTGEVNKNSETILTVNIGGENDIIKSFNGIKGDGLSGERVLEKNRLHLRSSRETELRSFLFFLNYFLKNSFIDGLSSKIYINNAENITDIKLIEDGTATNVNIEEKQFVYGKIDIKNFQGKIIGNTDIIGIAENNRLEIKTIINEETASKLLKDMK
ncbi:hypothetical protein [uncultured Cetobacterium sp.]|uniref:hypothetical protein n=1 Tax=uncultured Cetobacterium sp. TaxID=527638 RepID=UPI0026151DBC|nr:hypothetical protein [uncultured Cetobacterium sp.]